MDNEGREQLVDHLLLAAKRKKGSLKHTPTEMRWTGDGSQKSRPTATFRHGKNIWFRYYTCDVCGATKRRLRNIGFKRPAVCDGQ